MISKNCPVCGPGYELLYKERIYQWHHIGKIYEDGDLDLLAVEDADTDESYPGCFYCGECGGEFTFNKNTQTMEKINGRA